MKLKFSLAMFLIRGSDMSIKWVAIVSLMFLSMTADAAFQKTDWSNVGDELVTIDTSTGVEWLNLAATDNKSIEQVRAELLTTYSGWRLPTNDEVSALMYGIYRDVMSLEFSFYDARSNTALFWEGANSFAKLMSDGTTSVSYHLGLYFDEDGVIRDAGAYLNEGGAYTATHGLENTSIYSESTAIALSGVGGVFLVRGSDPVAPDPKPEPSPVPSPLGLGLLGLMGAVLLSRRGRM